MPNVKRLISLITVIAIVILAIIGIHFIQSQRRGNEANPASAVSGKQDALHSERKTSKDAGCYVLGSAVCDQNGKKLTQYLIDTNNNIADQSGTVVVYAEDAIPFSCVKSISYDNSLLRQLLATETGENGKESVLPKTFTIHLATAPDDAVNRTIKLESKKTDVLGFPLEANRAVLSDDAEIRGSGHMQTMTVIPGPDGTAEVAITAKAQGHAEVTAKNILGEEIAKLEFVFLADPAGVKGKATGSSSVTPAAGSMSNAGSGISSAPAVPKTGTDGHEHVFKTRTMTPTARTQGYTIHVCEICGYTYRDNYTDLITCSHNWRLVKTVPNTDISGGYSLYECTQCGQQERRNLTQETPAGGTRACSHVICSKNVVPATCTAAGYTIHECLICHDYSYRDEETPALGHSFGEGVVTKEPHCTEKGVITYSCLRCGETKTEPVPELEHSWDNGIITVTPALETRGIKTYTCKNCGEVKTEEIPALEHDWDEGVITAQPTCTATGVKTYTCRTTGQTRTEEIPMLPHTMTDEIIQPTYDAGGYTRHYCSVCGYELEHSDFTEPLEHEHSYESYQEAPTCTEDGYSVSICTVCGSETDREVLTATGHDYVMTVVEPTETEDGYIEFNCSRCNESYQSFHISAFAAMESEDGTILDLDQIAAAGKQWLQENGLEIIADITDEDLSGTVSDTVSMTVSQETAEALMRRTCFHAVAEAFESSMGLSGLKPVFYCDCDGLAESGLAVMNCMYSISAAE